MPHVTSIGLDVHARSVAAAAFNPFTGEVVHRDFGTDAAEIAEWALGFEEPRACYESGPTGFHMARELRELGLDCAVAAVSKMQRPAADARRKNDRRDAEFIARMLATVSVNLFFTSFAKQARRSRKGGFTGCANVFSPIPVTA